MLKGFYLTLMIGPTVPVPLPQLVLDSLVSIQVTSAAGMPSGFQLTFTLSNQSPLHTLFLVAGGAQIKTIRVIIVITVNGTPDVLMDGVMTNHQVAPGSDAGHSTLTVMGKDLTALMELNDGSGTPFPGMPAEARVTQIITQNYATYGMQPRVIPSIQIDVPVPTEHIPRQQGNDLAYITQLADEVGYVFYVDPGPTPGTSVGYWGPEIKSGAPQPALNINMDAHTNVESLSFSFNTDAATTPVIYVQDQTTKQAISIPIPAITPLNPPLGLVPLIPQRFEPIEGTAKFSTIRAILVGLAKAATTADAVTGSGSLDVLRYGRVLKSRQLVGVRGAGPAFDGLYFVKSVTHNIKRGEYKQSFELSRNGLLSTVPTVPA